MKFFLKLILFYFLFVKFSYGNEDLFETVFHKIEIINKDFTQSKIEKIEQIKIISLENILNKILTKHNFKRLNRLLDINKEKNYLIKNILIENEFISLNKYSANIKINYDKDEIIKMLRKYKIDYTGLSHNNNFYKKSDFNNYGLLNFIYPNLSLNDRYILPYNKIANKDLNSFIDISLKYNVEYIFIIFLKKNNQNLFIELNLFSFSDKKF